MQLHIFTKKVNLTSFANYKYWGNFDTLLELPLDDSQFLKLIEFFQAVMEYRTYAQDTLNKSDGFNFKFFTSQENPLIGYLMFGLKNKDLVSTVLRNNPIFENYEEKRNILFSELGWNFEEEKEFIIESEFNEVTEEWSNLPSTFAEIEVHYNTAKSLGSI